MRITLARAGPVAIGFGCDVVTFGFPFAQVRPRGSTRTAVLATPADVAGFVASGTSIGDGGEHFAALAGAGRFRMLDFPGVAGFPAALGSAVATTPSPAVAKACGPRDVARELAAGRPQLLVLGLGPRGLPKELLDAAPWHLEATGRGVSLETATALGAIPAAITAHLDHLEAGA